MKDQYIKKNVTVILGKLKDINPIYFEDCIFKPGGVFSAKRNHTTISYCYEGTGTLDIYGKSYEVHAGQVFIIPQGVMSSCRASIDDPWKRITVGFDGERCRDFNVIPTVFDYPSDLFDEILMTANFDGRMDIIVASIIMRMYSAWMPHDSNQTDNDLEGIKLYIENNFMLPLSVENIAGKFHMNRTYLSRIFKKAYGKSLKEYITYIRLKEARSLLNQGKNVTEAALLCGFNSSTHFSFMFKKYYNCPPENQKLSKLSKELGTLEYISTQDEQEQS